MSAPLAAINLSAGTERQWQGILRPRGRIRVPRPKSRSGMMRPAGIRSTTRRRATARGGCCRVPIPAFTGLATDFAALQRWVTGERWVKRLAIVIARAGGDLRRLFRRAVVAARRRSDQSRHGDAVACGRDRGQYRPRQYGRGRRHADRARRPDPDRGAHPRHRGPRPRPRHRRQRAEGRGETIRHRAADGAAARREPQSGRCRTRGADHAGRPGDGVRRRHRQAARDRRRLEARRRAWRRHSRARRRRPRQPAPRRLPDTDAERIAGRPRLARQPEPDRPRRTEPQRDRPEERQSGRRRSAARQQMDVREYQPEPAPAERRRRGAEPRRGGRASMVAAGRGRAAAAMACDRSIFAPTRCRPPTSCWRCG